MSGRYPKADTLQKLWDNLKNRVDAISEARGDRWDLGFHSAEPDMTNRVYTRSGGFLDRIDQFDAEFFGMSPREATNVDPQHRLLLELTWEALESGGFRPSDLAGSKTGVFVGISSQDYATLSCPGVDAYTNIGSAMSIASNRISYVFDFHGPSMSIDTACSSSLVAMHEACRAIAAGDCSMAVVGGINILATIRPWLGFAEASMLSPDGRCKSFDADGKGYVRAEGGGIVVIKPLADAERDGDEILGVILGTGVNSDGRTMGMALPSGEAQEALLREVYARVGISADDVFYVEAHGTGTSVGDPIECGALGRVLGAPRTGKAPCYIGSVKSNIGHLESGAAIAGLTKLLLALKHREIPANLHFNTPNPKIEFDAWKLKVVDAPLPLPKRSKPLVFGINSFGFGGTNAHLVLQEYRAPARAKAAPARKAKAPKRWNDLLMLSARSAAALNATAGRWADFLADVDAKAWDEVRAAAALQRDQHAYRLVVAGSKDEIAARLALIANGGEAPASARARATTGPRKLAFVFSGNGPQWWGMGRELLAENEIFRAKMQDIDAIFAPLAGWSLIEMMSRPEADVAIARTEIAQPLLFAQQVALMAVLSAAGLTADATFGHSVGEVAAAHASGALSLADATKVIIHRSSLQARTAGHGRMAAVGLGPDEVAKEIAKIPGWLEIAAVNSPRSVTVAGDAACLEQLRDRLTDEGHFVRLLALDYPFHTRAMDLIREDVQAKLAAIKPKAASIPFISTVTGAAADGKTLGAAYWWKNIREPVAFAAAVASAMDAHEITDFIEIGPHPVLKDYIQQCAKAADKANVVTHTTLRRPAAGKPVSDRESLAAAICGVYAHGVARPEAIFAKPAQPIALPLYAWQRERFWRGGVLLPWSMEPTVREHPVLGSRGDATETTWKGVIQPILLPYLNDHVVQGARLFPAAGYIEMILSAGLSLHGGAPVELEGMDILRPLVLADKTEPHTELAVDAADGTLSLRSRPSNDAPEWTAHVRGRIIKAESARPGAVDITALRGRMPVVLTGKAHYAGCDRRGLSYGPTFQGVTAVHLTSPDAATRMALAEIRLPWLDGAAITGYRAHPALLDSCLQVLVSLIGQTEPRDCATIPVHVTRLRSFAPLTSAVYCHATLVSENARSGVADLAILDAEGNVLVTLEGARFTKVEFRSSALPLMGEGWQVDPTWTPVAQPAIALPSAAHIAAAIAAPADAAAPVAARLDALARAYAVRALAALGADAPAPFTAQALARKAGVTEDQQPLFERLVGLAAEAGALKKVQGRWLWNTAHVAASCEAAFKALMLDHPLHVAELMALARAGNTLVDRLTGAAAAGTAMLETLEDTSPYRLAINDRVAAAVGALVRAWPKAAAVRIAEFGASTGGLTAHVLPLLPVARTDYLAVDASEQALGRLRNRFAQFPTFRTALAEKAETAGRFALALGVVTPHETANIADVIAQARKALVPGGVAVLAIAHATAFTDLVLGPPQATAVGVADIAGLMTDAGFAADEISVLPQGAAHTLVIAKSPMDATEPLALPGLPAKPLTLVVTEAEAASPMLSALLRTLGGDAAGVRVRAITADITEAAMLDVVREARGSEAIVHLAGWAHPAPTDNASYDALLDTRVHTAVLMSRAIEAVGAQEDAGQSPALTLVTRGAFAGPNGLGPMEPAQAALAGLGRVIANEQGSVGCRLIDLPADAADEAAGVVLAHALHTRDAETEVTLVQGQRWVNRARATTRAEQSAAADFLPDNRRAKAEAFKLDFLPQGGLDSLHLAAIDRRAPAADEVEIRVQAAGLNFRDVLWAMGMLPEEAVEHGFSGPTIGMECAGEVVRIGSAVTHLVPGDRIIAFASSCFASHVTTKANSVAKIPANLSFAEAATVPTVFVTAWYALDYLARLEPGETVLIHGAAGGVGLAALQIAKLKGAIVIGTAGSEDKQRLVRMMGADHVLSSRSLAFADEVMKITNGAGVDVVLNSLAGEAITKGLNILKPFGRFLEIGKRDLYANSRIGLRPFRQNLSYFGIDADTLLVERPALAKRVFDAVVAAMAAGDLRPLPHTTTPITRAAEAFRSMQQSRHVGKLVVTIDDATFASASVAPNRSSTVRPGVTYLVTGGLAGFGLSTAEWLIAEGATSLALLGRRGPDTAEAQEAIQRMTAAGATVRGFACDVADAAQLRQVLATVRAEMAPLKGVIHAAALIEDAPLMKIDANLLHRVHAAKVLGALHLDRETREDDLEMFVLYSSSSAVVGNPGQGAYVAANIVLDQIAEKRRAAGLAALSVGWGAIKDAGFLTRNQHVEDMLAQRAGMEATPVREALAALGHLLACGAVHVAASQFNMLRLGQNLAGARTPRFFGLVPEGMLAAAQGANSIASALEGMPEEERRKLLFDRIREHVGRVVGSVPEQIDPEKSLTEMGLDSLMAVELAEALEHDIGRPVSVMQMIQAGKVNAIVEILVRSFRSKKAADAAPADAKPEGAALKAA